MDGDSIFNEILMICFLNIHFTAFVFAIWIEDKKIIPKVDCIPCVKMCPSLRVRKNSENQEDNA